MPPQGRPVTIKYELVQALDELGLDHEMDVYKSLLGHEGKNVEPLVQSPKKFTSTCSAKGSSRKRPTAIWTDTNVYNELGIPAIKIGPRGRRINLRNEEFKIDEMVKAAQLCALMALDICSRDR
jgi:acetylornithine deacetylase/succinyl-diaminopimelate desuccinylase-like protein